MTNRRGQWERHAARERGIASRTAERRACEEIEVITRPHVRADDLKRLRAVLANPHYEGGQEFFGSAITWLEANPNAVLGRRYRMALARTEGALKIQASIRARGGTLRAWCKAPARSTPRPPKALKPAWMFNAALLPKRPPGRP